MQLDIKATALADLVNYFSDKELSEHLERLVSDMSSRRRYYPDSQTFPIYVEDWELDDLKVIRDALSFIRARVHVRRLDSIISVLESPNDAEIKSLEAMPTAVRSCMANTEHHWVFISEKLFGEETLVPYFVHNVYYEPEHYDKDKYFCEAYVLVEIHNISYDGERKRNITFYNNNINGRTLVEAFKDKSMFIENEELYKEYKRMDDKFVERLKEQGKQYKVMSYIDPKNEWYGHARYSISKDDSAIPFYHVVNDSRSSDQYSRERSCSFWETKKDVWGHRVSGIAELPVIPVIKGYNLDRYCECYVHVDDIEDYEYDHSLRDKLVLPQSHKALLDILVNNSSILKGDIINNKGNGTVVILEGPPGCGKTLTTEVYSELIEKPLYRISAGQLGTNGKDMDKNLYDVLNRAERLDCILLIDECEIFVKKRGDDLEQNAIVTTFLRKIEYFDGILFLTSNRIKDVDEAILSRCIAAIKYAKPTEENAKKIWKVLATQFKLDDQVNDEMINTLVKVFPEAVGRDIKELLKLTARYCQGNNKKIDIQSFLDCAQFRYIDANEKYIESLGLQVNKD